GAPVELLEPRRESRASCARLVEAGAVAPRIGPPAQALLLGEPSAEAARRAHERRLGGRGQRRRDRHLPTALWTPGRRSPRLRAERLEPGERVVVPLPAQAREVGIAARALGAEVLPVPVPPHHTAREEHRAAGARPFLDHRRPEPELARAGSADETGHAGAGD